jgi:hypothetical protein
VIQIIQANDNDYDDMAELARENYGDIDISNTAYLMWQYNHNPAGKALIRIARDGKELAAQYINIPIRVLADGQMVRGALSLNTITREKYRGLGLFPILASQVFEDCINSECAFTIGFPNPNSYPGFIRKLSFLDLGSVPLLIKPLKIAALIKKSLCKLEPSAQNKLMLTTYDHYRKNGLIIRKLTPEDKLAIDQLWNKVKGKYPVMQVRDYEFIKWRYFDVATRNYLVLGAWKENVLQGFIVGRCTTQAGIKCGMIVDFLILKKETNAGETLIREIMRYFISNNMELAGALMLKHTEEYTLLKRNFFCRCPHFLEPQPFPMIYREHIEMDLKSLTNINHWFLTMGDYDVI